MSAWFIEFFPPLVRYCAVGIGYNFSQAIFGGTAPLIATALISCHCCSESLAPMAWVTFVCLISALGIYQARKQVLAPFRLDTDSNDEDEDEAAEGCPESMAQAKSLLTTTIAVCFIIGVSSMAATGSVANISTEAQTGQHCAKLEVSYCARVLEASGECPALQGCVSPHDGHELAGGEEEGEGLACLCARHEEHAEHVEGEEGASGFVDWAFMLASLFFTALGVRKVASSSDAIGPGAPLPQVASQQPSPPPPAAERVDPRAHYEKTGRYMGERSGWCYGDGSFGLGYYKVSSREAFLSVLNARRPSLKFAEENGNFTPASVASVDTGAEVTQKTGWAFGYGPVGLGYYKDPEYKGEGVLPSGVDNPIAGAGVAEGVDGFVGDADDADDDLIL